MKHTTHMIPLERKEELFEQHKELITIIHTCGDILLRKQIKRIAHHLTGKSEVDIEFAIAELINTGFLLQKQICKDSKTQILYLSKFPRSKFMEDRDPRDVPAIAFSSNKIFEQIFLGDYLIEVLIPEMKEQNFELSTDNLVTYLQYIGSTLLIPSNQYYNLEYYRRLYYNKSVNRETISFDLHRDIEIASYERKAFLHKKSKNNEDLPPCEAKLQRDTERDSFNSDIERSKNYFNLINMVKHNFNIEKMDIDTIHLIYFDCMNSIQTKKLYQTLSYILLMFQRYLNKNIALEVTVYTWDEKQSEELKTEETKKAYDFYNREWINESKKHYTMQQVGLLPSHWNEITVNYKSFDIFPKYHIHP